MTILMKNKKQTFRSYSQYQLKKLSDTICDDIEHLLSALSINEYKMLDKMIVMQCPIHGGDNNSAFNLYHTGDTYRGNWKCRTHGCESVFKSSILGFIRGCLSHQNGWSQNGDEVVSFADALEFAIKFTKTDPNKYKQSKIEQERHNFVKNISSLNANSINTNVKYVSKNVIRKNLHIPSEYFVSRGFSPDILDKYDVGDCKDNKKEMSNRAVVPIYDHEYKGMVGCTGRSIYDKCNICKSYHKIDQCPSEHEMWINSKWRHNKDFKTQEHLYNMWFAKEFIQSTRTAIIVESPGNVWRLEEAGVHNSVAIFGTNLSIKQKMLLDMSGAMTIITMMDNDPPGQEAAKTIIEKCNKTYNTKNVIVPKNDIAEMTVEQIQLHILPQLKEYSI
jgi:5S rRNA maturation endonuclease (ribonuclease M5)